MEQNFVYKNEKGPIFASIDVTGACNYNCLHCYNNSGQSLIDEMSDEELLRVADQIAELQPISICLCGGEPLMRKNIEDVVRIISNKNCAVNMVSNGSLLTKNKAYKLKKAGLHTLQISLDGVNSNQHDTFRGFPGAFDLATEAIKIGKEMGLTMVTSFIPNKLNVNSINDYLDYCCALGVTSARFMPLIPMGRGSNIDFLLLSSDEYYKLQVTLEKVKPYYIKKNMLIEWGDPIDHFSRMTINAKSDVKTVSLEVKANGNLTISTYIPIVVGNIRKHSIKEYWDAGYKDIWAKDKVVDFVSKIQNIYDINSLTPKPYSGEYYYLNIL